MTLEYKEALDFYIKQRPRTDYTNVNLRPWQNELLTHITNLTDRKVIWVIGGKCGEGESWFQDYVESLYGFNRVVAGMNIKVNTASLCHALQKKTISYNGHIYVQYWKIQNKIRRSEL